MVWIAVGLAAGIICCAYGNWLSAVYAGSAAALVLFVLRRPVWGCAALAVVLGAMDMHSHDTSGVYLPDGYRYYSGVVLDTDISNSVRPTCDVELTAVGLHPDNLQTMKRPVSARVALSFNSHLIDSVVAGKSIVFRTRMSRLDARRFHPEETNRDRRAVSLNQWHSCYVPPGDLISAYDAPGWRNAVRRFHSRMVTRVLELPIDTDAKVFLVTALLGNREWISDDSRNALSNSGLAHVIALSGFHIGIIYMILVWVLLPCRLLPAWPFRAVVILSAIWGFALLTGLSASVVRAAVMMTAATASILLTRGPCRYNPIGLAAVCVLAFAPYALFQPGFQLSFAAVTGIALYSRDINPWKDSRSTFLRNISQSVAVTIGATLGTWIIVAHYFRTFPVMFLAANLIAVPLLVPVTLISGLGAWLLYEIGCPDPLLGWMCERPYDLLSIVTSIFGAERFTLSLPELQWPCMVMWLVAAVLLKLAVSSRRNRLAGFGSAAAAVLAVALMFAPPSRSFASGSEWFVHQDRKVAQLVVRTDDRIDLIVADLPDSSTCVSMLKTFDYRFRDYITRRNITSVNIVPLSTLSSKTMDIGTERLVLLTEPNQQLPESDKPVTLMVYNGFKLPLDESILASGKVHRVLVDRDTHYTRLKRWRAQCKPYGIPLHRIGDGPVPEAAFSPAK